MTEFRSFLENDCFTCQIWLLTSKWMFPNSFCIHFECYQIEKTLCGAQIAATSFIYLIDNFPNEPILWTEIEKFITTLCMDTDCMTLEQTIFLKMFSELPLSFQERLLSGCAAAKGQDIMEHCRHVLFLINRFPKSSIKLALRLFETMLTAEKRNQCLSVINCYRKTLVCDLGPLLMSMCNLNQKTLYKLLTKTIEFYMNYAMGGHSIILNLSDTENYIETPWEDLFALCKRIGKKLSWKLTSVLNESDKQTAWNKVSTFAKKYVIASNNNQLRKQIVFCGTILLLRHVFNYKQSLQSENGLQYLLAKAVNRSTIQINKPTLKQVLLSLDSKLNESLIGITDESSEVLNNFKFAFNYWELLTNKEPICNDYWKLSAKIKVNTFIGQFLNDVKFFKKRYYNLFKVVPVQESTLLSFSGVFTGDDEGDQSLP